MEHGPMNVEQYHRYTFLQAALKVAPEGTEPDKVITAARMFETYVMSDGLVEHEGETLH